MSGVGVGGGTARIIPRLSVVPAALLLVARAGDVDAEAERLQRREHRQLLAHVGHLQLQPHPAAPLPPARRAARDRHPRRRTAPADGRVAHDARPLDPAVPIALALTEGPVGERAGRAAADPPRAPEPGAAVDGRHAARAARLGVAQRLQARPADVVADPAPTAVADRDEAPEAAHAAEEPRVARRRRRGRRVGPRRGHDRLTQRRHQVEAPRRHGAVHAARQVVLHAPARHGCRSRSDATIRSMQARQSAHTGSCIHPPRTLWRMRCARSSSAAVGGVGA